MGRVFIEGSPPQGRSQVTMPSFSQTEAIHSVSTAVIRGDRIAIKSSMTGRENPSYSDHHQPTMLGPSTGVSQGEPKMPQC